MPTVCELKERLKSLGIKGITGKKKNELLAMLEKASIPVPKKKRPIIKSFTEQVSEPLSVPKKKRPVIKSFTEQASVPEKDEMFGDEKSDHWITEDLLYDIRYKMDWDDAGKQKVVKKLKEAIAKFQSNYDSAGKTPHQKRMVLKLNNVLADMMKEYGRKKLISSAKISEYLQPLFTTLI